MKSRTVYEMTFRLHWMSGETTDVTGWGDSESDAVADAFRRAGYGGGALSVLDYYENTTEPLPAADT